MLVKDSDRIFRSIRHIDRMLLPDWDEYLILRDALCDEDDPLYQALEWMIEKGKRPLLGYTYGSEEVTRAGWYDALIHSGTDPWSDVPSSIFHTMKGSKEYNSKRIYPSLKEAVEDLHHALTELGLI